MSCIPFFKLLHISEYHYETKGFSESFNTLIIDVLLYSKCHIKAKACLFHCPKQSFCFSIITIVMHLSIDKQCYKLMGMLLWKMYMMFVFFFYCFMYRRKFRSIFLLVKKRLYGDATRWWTENEQYS